MNTPIPSFEGDPAQPRLRTFTRPAGATKDWRMPGMPCVAVRRQFSNRLDFQPLMEIKEDAEESQKRHFAWQMQLKAGRANG
jgi:hypothetical protein